MGMFDEIRCKFPLPLLGANGLVYQTKDTPEQFMDQYEIREDGTLWHEDYGIEDHSAAGNWKREHPGEEAPKELDGFFGCMSRVNKRFVPSGFTGEIQFYAMFSLNADGSMKNAFSREGWVEWTATFVNGKTNEIHLLSHRTAES